MKRLAIFLTMMFLLAGSQTKASHLLGGEITWECIKSGTNQGKFIFTIKIYCACYVPSASCPTSSASITNPLYAQYGGPSTIVAPRILNRDVAPPCYADSLELRCGLTRAQGGTNVMDENIYVSSPIQINGTPATTGSDFTWTSCCRPNTSDMINIVSGGYWLKATMYPYNDPATSTTLSVGSTTSGPSCYDSSPVFASSPATVICKGYPFTYNHNAEDAELDSLHYAWYRPLISSTNGVTWKTGYSTTMQLPNSNHSSLNSDPTINGLTGEISMHVQYIPSTVNGYHSTGVKVEAYKCKQKVAEIFRDLPVVIISCPPTPTIPPIANTPPDVTFKWNVNDPFPIPLPAGDTVWAGDLVDFYVTSTDIEFRPPGFTGQTNYLIPNGLQIGAGFADTNSGCPYPPCAVLDTASAYFDADSGYWSGQYGLATYFYWKTDCNHLAQVTACFTRSNTYNFVFEVQDDWCPAPGLNYQTFAITVLAPPALEPPQMKCAEVLPNNSVVLRWTQPVVKTEDTLNSFRKYLVMRSDSGANGPYDSLHIVLDMDSLTYTDNSANIQLGAKYYFVRGISSCNDQGDSILGDTISGMRLSATVFNSGNSVALNWNDYNPGNRWGTSTTGEYYVWVVVAGDTSIVDTVTESWDTLQINYCYPTLVDYYVTVIDTTTPWGCISNSTVSGGTVGDNLAPDAVVLDSVSFDQTNNVLHLGWTHPNPDVGVYYIYKGSTLIDSISGNLNTYTYTRLPADPLILDFSIQGRDTCNNLNNPGPAQSSMMVTIDNLVLCTSDKKVEFSWNAYNPGWSGGSGYSFIYRSMNGGPYVLIDSVIGTSTAYADTTIVGDKYYRYRVRSWENGKNRGVWTAWDSITVPKLIKDTRMPAPTLLCLSYTNDSTLRLEWDRPPVTDTNLTRYVIQYSTDGSNWSDYDSINGNRTGDNKVWYDNILSYDATGITGTGHYFRITSSAGCDGIKRSLTPSAAFRAIDLDVSTVSDSALQLNWNQVTSPTVNPQFNIERNGGNIANPAYSTTTYQDKKVVCDLDVQYRIGYPNFTGTYNCTSYSKFVDSKFKDRTPPAKQFVDSVSMRQDTSYTGMVGWSKNPSKDVVKYYAMYCTPGSYKILDTVNSNQPLFFEDVKNAPLEEITQYAVTAVDSCGNNTLTTLDFDCHSTIKLDTRMDFCDQSIRLNWNDYTDWSSGTPVSYTIYVGVNGGQFNEVGRTNDAKFKYKDLVNGNNYCFFVQAWDNNGVGPFSSSSAVECLDALFIDKPEFAYMKYATVSDTNEIRIGMKIDLESNIGEYWIKRATSANKNYKIIATVPVPDPPTSADSNFYYQDHEVLTNRYSYYYKIDVVDPCGDVGKTSNIGRTMHLTVGADNEKNRNILTWNQYEEWNGGVNEYEVYRGIDGQNMKLVRSLVVRNFASDPTVSQDGEIITFVDDVSDQATTGNGQFCYKILAKEGTGSFPGVNPQQSESNVECTVQYPLFYVPTAFTPNGDGLNDRFLPLGAFHDIKSYNLEIFNRWGEMIYSTNDYSSDDAGWDGTYNGKEVPSGAYVYIVKYKSADGQEFEQQGTITIAR